MKDKFFCWTVNVVLPWMLLAAAPVAKEDPVAEGYPRWQGVTAKNYIVGRELCPSDLRHKVTVVVDFENNASLQGQLVQALPLVESLTDYPIRQFQSENLETAVWPRDTLVVFSNRGKAKDREAIVAALKNKTQDENIGRAVQMLRSVSCSFYDDVSFEGGPDSSAKRPFVYVMGPEGTKPLYQGKLDAETVGAALKVAKAARDKLRAGEPKWKPFFGKVTEPSHHPEFAKAVAKGKTLLALEKALLKDIAGNDTEKSVEAQMLFDALEQTRSDLCCRVLVEAGACPHRAYYDIQQVVKYWPSEKKRLDAVLAQIKAIPGGDKLAKMFCKMVGWMDPDFMCKNAGEVKKIVSELGKMKKDLAKMKESPVVVIQNGALILDMKADELMAQIPSRVVGI